MEEDDDTTKVLPEWVELEYRVSIQTVFCGNNFTKDVLISKCLFWLVPKLRFISHTSLALRAPPWHLLSATGPLKRNVLPRKRTPVEY